jgi:hypothetical protein
VTAGIAESRLWKGWLLPASEEDVWFVAGSAAYYRMLAAPDFEKQIESTKISYRGLKLGEQNEMTRHAMEQAKGVLFLDRLRRRMGDDAFLKLMSDFHAENTTKNVSAKAFLEKAGTRFEVVEPGEGPAYLTIEIYRRLGTAAIVYGTAREAGANRYAAEKLQADFLNQHEKRVPIYKDFEASEAVLREHDVIFVGRPETNPALAGWAERIGLKYEGAAFTVDGATHASEREALLWAATNPLDASRMVLVVAGNDALRTVKAFRAVEPSAYVVWEDGGPSPTSGRSNSRSR